MATADAPSCALWRSRMVIRRPSEWTTRTLRTRACASLGEATLLTTSPMLIQEPNRAAYRRVENEVRLTRYGGDCYAYCALAAGFVDLVVETSIKPHDIVALIPIIEGAGGLVTTWDGEEAAKGGRIIAAGDPAVHEQARRMLVQGRAVVENSSTRTRIPPKPMQENATKRKRNGFLLLSFTFRNWDFSMVYGRKN